MSTVDDAGRRRLGGAWWGAAAAAGSVLAIGAAFARSMPDPVAVHWGADGRPNGSMPLWLGLAVAPVVAGLGILASTRSQGRRSTAVVAVALGVTLQALIVWANEGVNDWTAAREVPLWSVLVVLGVPLAAASLASRRGRAARPPRWVPPSVEQARTAWPRATWSSSATNKPLLAALAVVLLLGLWTQAYAYAVAAVACAPFTWLRASVGRQGVLVTLGLPRLLRRRYRIESLASASVGEHRALSYGYRGSRKAFTAATWAVRRGETLVLHFTDLTTLSITVDDAARGAALVNELVGAPSAA